MCDLFEANPWKPLLCTNCHQNRSGHRHTNNGNKILEKSQQPKDAVERSSSSMHLYEEIMAQYFTINPTDDSQLQSTSFIERTPSPVRNDDEIDSFSDEEQEATTAQPAVVEFIQSQAMVSTQGIVLMGPDLNVNRTKQSMTTKKSKKIISIKKSKSNADECSKKVETTDANTAKTWWFKAKKSVTSPTPPIVQSDTLVESPKPTISSPSLTGQVAQQQRVRVLPEINKLTTNEALNIARRQHLSFYRDPKLFIINKPLRVSAPSIAQSTYGSSIASSTSSSTQSSSEYDSTSSNNATTAAETTYLIATPSVDNALSLTTMLDKMNKLTIEHLTFDLRGIIDEYKRNLPVARFQTLKAFLHHHQSTKILSDETTYLLLLQIIDEISLHTTHTITTATTLDHFLIAHHSTIPIVVTTSSASSSIKQDDESNELLMKTLIDQLFHSSSTTFTDLETLEATCCRYLSNHVLQFSNSDSKNTISMYRVQLLDLFWNKIQSLRYFQINDENERFIFVLYHLMRRVCQSDNLI